MPPFAMENSPYTIHPTTTEHDFRFPRRPLGHDDPRQPARSRELAGYDAAGMTGFDFDFSGSVDTPGRDILQTATLPALQNGISGQEETFDDLRQNDPLATQIWKFFSKTKQSLPHQGRMENITWRMMHVDLRKQQQEANAR